MKPNDLACQFRTFLQVALSVNGTQLSDYRHALFLNIIRIVVAPARLGFSILLLSRGNVPNQWACPKHCVCPGALCKTMDDIPIMTTVTNLFCYFSSMLCDRSYRYRPTPDESHFCRCALSFARNFFAPMFAP